MAVLTAFAAAWPLLALPDRGFAPPLVMPGTNWAAMEVEYRFAAGIGLYPALVARRQLIPCTVALCNPVAQFCGSSLFYVGNGMGSLPEIK